MNMPSILDSNITDEFINTIYCYKNYDIPTSVEKKVKECLIDYIGVTLAGSFFLRNKEENFLKSVRDNDEQVFAIGHKRKMSIINAIFLNGLSSHFLELDDGIRYGAIHPGAPIFSALIPIAYNNKIAWKQFLLGVITGYEASIRLATAIQPYHYNAGYHPTATCCTVGVAIGIGIMLDLTKNELKDALSSAAISAAGSLKVLDDTSQLKPFNIARAGLMGYISVCMSISGFSGPQDALLGNAGFLMMMSGKYNKKILISNDEKFSIDKVYIKPYASCRHTHAAIECAFKIRGRKRFDINNIKNISINTYDSVIGKHDSTQIFGEASAKMSIPYCVAVALKEGSADISKFVAPFINDPFILFLTKKILVFSNEELSKLVPHKRVAVVELTTNDGEVFIERVEFPKGEPENPLSEDELYTKFLSLSLLSGLDKQICEQVFNETYKFEDIDIQKIFTLIS